MATMDQSTTLSPAKQALLQQRLRSALSGQPRAPEIPQRPDREVAPLSFAQRQMWVIDQMTPGNPAYNLPNGYRLRGALDLAALEGAMNDIIARHEALRTTFGIENGEPAQRIHPELVIRLGVTALSDLPVAERERRMQALATEEALRPFDLSRLPLVRMCVFVLGEAEHVLIINLHHIIADGLSVSLLASELDACYRARTHPAGAQKRLPALAVQYPDYAAWQRQTVAGAGAFARELEYWRTRLGGALTALELPTDRPRPAVQSFGGSNVFFEIPAPLADGLKALAAREGCTAFMTVLAAFQALLHRYSGAEDLVIGTPVGMRPVAELEPVIGNFLNMTPLRCDLAGDPTFIELMRRARETALDAFSNAAAPFEAVASQLKVQRDPSRNPVFQVMLQVLSATPPCIGGLEVSGFHFDLGFAQFDLSLHLYEEAGGYVGRLEFCTALFQPETARRMASHFDALLRAVVADPERKLSQLQITCPAEIERILREWNATESRLPAARLVHELVQQQAARTPERRAVVAGTTTLNYATLAARASRLAHALRARGAGRGQRVGICLERGADMLATLLGVLEAGAAYVPLDPSFPSERLRLMAEDAGLSLVVSVSALARLCGVPRERQLLLDADGAAIESTAGSAPDTLPGHPEDPAYIIYTSGSTGQPKGVVIPHRAVVNFLASMARSPGLSAEDVLVAVSTLSFDIAILELLLPLSVGATVVIAPQPTATDGSALAALLQSTGATVMQATPVTWRLLLEGGWAPRAGLKGLVGGEALPRDLAEELVARGVEVWNMYGPTETTVWSTCARIIDTAKGITIGGPIANTVVRILDAHMGLCPVGVPGQLYIGGQGLALGYWNRPQLTQERFIPDPFGAAPGAMLYCTGDRARWLSDGTLEHLGRLDDQVKVRGFRIELGEIEAVLAEHPDVRQAAVHLWAAAPNDLRIVACCVPARGTLAAINLRKHLRARLPEYMIPQYFVPVNEIALTPNGKVDRRRLPKPVVTESRVGRHEPPEGLVETAIAAIWSRLVQPARPVSRTDRFFEIGGYSLLGLRALREIEATLGAKLEFQVLFGESLTDIAARCGTAQIAERGTGLAGAGA